MKKKINISQKMRFQKRLGILASIILALFAVLCFVSGTFEGVASGFAIATVPIFAWFKDGKFTQLKPDELKQLSDEQLMQYKSDELNQNLSPLKSELSTLKTNLDENSNKLNDITKGLENLTVALQTKSESKTETITFKKAMLNFFEENKIKSIKDLKKFVGQEFTIKAENPLENTDYTGNVSRSQQIGAPKFAPLRPLAFLNNGIRIGVVENEKNILLWVPAVSYATVGYAGELDNITTGASEINGSYATAQEKTRLLAKLAARMVISNEAFEDLTQFVQRAEARIVEQIMLDLDSKIYDGDGVDGGPNIRHIYGLIPGQVTAFDDTVFSYQDANIADLVGACSTQALITNYVTDTVWMSPTLLDRLRTIKDLDGNYLINAIPGTNEFTVRGHRIVVSTIFESNGTESIIVGSSTLIQLWIKRNFEMKMIEIPERDAIAMYWYFRGQVLVEDADLLGLIYVADVDAAITAITI